MNYDQNGNPILYNTSGYETVGDEVGYDELGAPALARRPMAPMGRQQPQARPGLNPAFFAPSRPGFASAAAPSINEQQIRAIARQELQAIVPYGAVPPRPQDNEAMFPLGLGFVLFTDTSATTLTLIAQPQRSFRGERLILSIGKNGAGAQNTIVLLSDFKVGDISQKIGGGVLPAEVFSADAFGVRLMLDGAVPGMNITLTFNLSNPLALGESIFVSGAIIGRATEMKG